MVCLACVMETGRKWFLCFPLTAKFLSKTDSLTVLPHPHPLYNPCQTDSCSWHAIETAFDKAANHLAFIKSEGNLSSFTRLPAHCTEWAVSSSWNIPFIFLQITLPHITVLLFLGSFASFSLSIWPVNVCLPWDLVCVLFCSIQNNLFLSHSFKYH